MFASNEGVDEHEADLCDRVGDGDGADVLVALPHAATKAASRLSRFQRHLVIKFVEFLMTFDQLGPGFVSQLKR